jgi:hypothetical protein
MLPQPLIELILNVRRKQPRTFHVSEKAATDALANTCLSRTVKPNACRRTELVNSVQFGSVCRHAFGLSRGADFIKSFDFYHQLSNSGFFHSSALAVI